MHLAIGLLILLALVGAVVYLVMHHRLKAVETATAQLVAAAEGKQPGAPSAVAPK